MRMNRSVQARTTACLLYWGDTLLPDGHTVEGIVHQNATTVGALVVGPDGRRYRGNCGRLYELAVTPVAQAPATSTPFVLPTCGAEGRMLLMMPAGAGRPAMFVYVPNNSTSTDYDVLYPRLQEHLGLRPGYHAWIVAHLTTDQCASGVYYEWGVSGPDGAWYQLFRLPHNTDAQLREAAAHLRRTQDVTSLCTTKVPAIIDPPPLTWGRM